MRSYYKGVARDQYGAIISGAVIDIYLANSVTPANVYTVSTGGTAVNSVTADAEGVFYFYVDTSDYSNVQLFKLVISHLGNTSTYDNISVFYYDNYYIDALGEYGSGTAYTQATIESALTAIGTVNKVTLLLRPGTWVLTSDLTIPANITLKLPAGAIITIPTGKTLTINGPFEAGLYQVFDGTVVFSDDAVVAAYPEWWGVDGTADEVEINKALAAARTVVLSYREYNIASTINIPMHGLAYFTPYQILGQGVSGAIASYGSRLSWVGGNGEPGRPARVLQLGGNCVVKNINIYNKNSATALIGVDCSGDVSTVWPSYIVLENIYVKACGVGFAMIYCGCIDATNVVATLCGYGFMLGRDSNAITFNNITANSCTIGITDKGVITGKETFHGSRVVVLNSLNLEGNTMYGMDIGDDRSNSWVINGLYAENNYDVALRPTSKVARLSGHVSITGGLINETGGIPFEIGGGEDICCLEFYNFWVRPDVTQLIDVTESTLTQFNSKSVKLPRGCTNITCIANSILNKPELISAGILNPDCYTKLETPVLDLTSTNNVPVSIVGEDWITGASLTAGSYLVAAYMVVTADITPIAPSFNVGLGEFGGGSLAGDSFLSGTDVVIGVYSIPLDSGVIQKWDSSAYSMMLITNAATNGRAKFVFFLV